MTKYYEVKPMMYAWKTLLMRTILSVALATAVGPAVASERNPVGDQLRSIRLSGEIHEKVRDGGESTRYLKGLTFQLDARSNPAKLDLGSVEVWEWSAMDHAHRFYQSYGMQQDCEEFDGEGSLLCRWQSAQRRGLYRRPIMQGEIRIHFGNASVLEESSFFSRYYVPISGQVEFDGDSFAFESNFSNGGIFVTLAKEPFVGQELYTFANGYPMWFGLVRETGQPFILTHDQLGKPQIFPRMRGRVISARKEQGPDNSINNRHMIYTVEFDDAAFAVSDGEELRLEKMILESNHLHINAYPGASGSRTRTQFLLRDAEGQSQIMSTVGQWYFDERIEAAVEHFSGD
jgi:hypothetical protein